MRRDRMGRRLRARRVAARRPAGSQRSRLIRSGPVFRPGFCRFRPRVCRPFGGRTSEPVVSFGELSLGERATKQNGRWADLESWRAAPIGWRSSLRAGHSHLSLREALKVAGAAQQLGQQAAHLAPPRTWAARRLSGGVCSAKWAPIAQS